MKIAVHGTGLIGLVTGACFAEVGNDVVCFDTDASRINALQCGQVGAFEPGLHGLVERNVKAGRLQFTSDITYAARIADLHFIAVGTPACSDGKADVQYVLQAARSIGQHMERGTIVVNKSTSPVGTADGIRTAIAEALAQRGLAHPFCVVSNPEFLREGSAIADGMRPARIVLGCEDAQAMQTLRTLYAPFQHGVERIIPMDTRSAELTKYAANAMLATRISFMNEIAHLAETLGADVEQVRQGVGSDPRIGADFLRAGAGYGGSCFPKDLQALQVMAQSRGVKLRLLNAVQEVNGLQKHVLADKVQRRFGNDLRGLRFALWGLAFKAQTSDMREASSLTVIDDLLKAGAALAVYDPAAMLAAQALLPQSPTLHYAASVQAALEGADALIIVTEWQEFCTPDFSQIKASLKHPVIFDGRNLYEPASMRSMGFEYHAIGRRDQRAGSALLNAPCGTSGSL